ncbi:hypothetical protein Taro_017714 [Colocasia esculenta]|uniref:HTH OST-type domain-containing protein n=1 Tax=Colocasia esculenta TaxID=4460 RepID=A0A843UWW2_COLES|nr:hypothetical protein [Colocasia esculenta]
MRAPNAPSCVLLFLSSPSLHAFRAHAISFRSGPGCELQRRWTGSSAASAAPALHSSPSTCRRQHDEESKGVKVTVWWDLENCHVPSGVNVFQVPHRITSALRAHGIRGPVSITAFGDVSRMTHAALDALCTSGVRLNHVPICEKNSSDRSLLVDLVYWVARNPPPLHFFLISSNRAFANILHRLRMNNYNILLASKRGASCALMSSATVMWQWSTLVSGESLTGMHVNHPPDGLYDSWYGHCRGSLDNLLPDPEQATVTQPEESLEPTTDAISRQISEALVEEIRQILHLHPEGISIAELFSELKRSNVALDKDYFLHRKFFHLLLSMPNIFRIKFTPGDSQTLEPLEGLFGAQSTWLQHWLVRTNVFNRYGYVLDYQKLGYVKLASMLQIMPGVRIQSSHALPAAVVHPDSMRQKGAPEEMRNPSLQTRMTSGLDGEDLANGNHHDEWED